jgi:hypothetical protein
MRKSYKTLTGFEFNVLDKIIKLTGCDCWAFLKQDRHGVDYIYDIEEGKRLCLRTGVGLIAESLDCQENLDNCCLHDQEKETLRGLFLKLGIKLDSSIDWKLEQED